MIVGRIHLIKYSLQKQSLTKRERRNRRGIFKVQKRDEEHLHRKCCKRNQNVEISDKEPGGGTNEGEDEAPKIHQQEEPGVQRSTGGGRAQR